MHRILDSITFFSIYFLCSLSELITYMPIILFHSINAHFNLVIFQGKKWWIVGLLNIGNAELGICCFYINKIKCLIGIIISHYVLLVEYCDTVILFPSRVSQANSLSKNMSKENLIPEMKTSQEVLTFKVYINIIRKHHSFI